MIGWSWTSYLFGVLTVPAIFVAVCLYWYFGLNRDVGKLK